MAATTTENAPRIVLCRPSHAGNIGAAARALRVMGLSELALVQPRQYPHPEASTRAAGSEDVLDAARVVDTLAEAVGDCVFVVGLSARGRHEGPAVLDVAEAARQVVARSSQGPVAFVFGNERTGMTNEELNACHAVATIPTGPYISSLNLAAAVQVVSYEVLRARQAVGREAHDPVQDAVVVAPTPLVAADPDDQPARRSSVDAFLARLWAQLEGRGGFFADDPRFMKMQERLRRLIDRAGPTEAEMRAAHGVISWFKEEASHGRPATEPSNV